ncbi:acid protease [Microthyrium microscopicum]|uniref:Acid protease n=1 Tax=Microthyrium microscopicum TaxID=703497 RepID=A0A6A6TWJ0_9PEZI|nr:acid protease [Microthyrium microscopicum]
MRAARNPRLTKRQEQSLASALQGQEYLTEIKFEGTPLQLIVDTGSSDTWLIESSFQCTDANSQAVSQATCNFGPTYPGTFSAEEEIPNVNFNIGYGDGEFVTGVFGKADIEIAGITVPQQTAALGTSAYWNGDGISSGLLGLAYPGLTSEYQGSDPNQDGTTRITYDPIFTNMYKQGLSSAMFSMAIERGTGGGYIAFGGLPPVNVTGDWATVPIQQMTSSSTASDDSDDTDDSNAAQTDYQFYTLTPDSFEYGNAKHTVKDQYIVDSGTTLVYASTATTKAINALFKPAATVSNGYYSVSCSATAPNIAVVLGGQAFSISVKDLIVSDGAGGCISGVQDGGSGPYILGDVFMSNVVVAFDVGAAEMRFAAHNY